MKKFGFCTGSINFLVLYLDRYDVVHLNRLDTEVVQDLFDLLCRSLEVEAEPITDRDHSRPEVPDLRQKIIDCFEKIWKALGLKDSPFRKSPQRLPEWIAIMISMVNLVDLIVLLYCSAHLERFDQKYLQMSLEGLRIDFTVEEIDSVVFKRRSLACLNKHLCNRQVWVLQLEKRIREEENLEGTHAENLLPLSSDRFIGESIRGRNTQLSVSTCIQDLADIWGPLCPVKIEGLADVVAFQAGTGVLVPWPNGTAVNEDGEMYYHWTEDLGELPARLAGFTFPKFIEKQPLLIGGDNSRLEIESSCCFTPRQITQKLKDANCLRMQGTERPRIYQDSETISGTMGYIVSLTGAITLKRSAGGTVKDNILSTWRPENLNRNPKILECWYGVEVSACNGNARRRRLKDLFNLPAIRKHLDLCHSDWTTTDYGNRFSETLADQDKRAFRRLWRDNPEWQSELQKLVYTCFDALRNTGADGKNQLSVFWMSDIDQQSLVDIPAGLSSWTGILKNNEFSCSMAVLSTSCLSLIPSYSRCFPVSDCREERSDGYTLMETALVINRDARVPKGLSYSRECGCGSKRCWDTHKLEKNDCLSLGQLGEIVVLESSDDHTPILARWKAGVATELRIMRDEVRANISKGSPSPHHWEVMDSNDERRRYRPVQLFLISHSLKRSGRWKAR